MIGFESNNVCPAYKSTLLLQYNVSQGSMLIIATSTFSQAAAVLVLTININIDPALC